MPIYIFFVAAQTKHRARGDTKSDPKNNIIII